MVLIWRVTIWYEESRTLSQTLHTAETRKEAIRKALAFIPACADWSTIHVRRAVVEEVYEGNPADIVI
jgi:hypothetical protein